MTNTPINLKLINKYQWVTPAHDQEIEKQLALHGSLDIEEFEQRIPDLLELCDGIDVVDVGAYTGDTALTFLKLGAERVFAFEAFYDSYCALCINLPQPAVLKYHAAVGDGRKVKLDGAGVYPGMRYVEPGEEITTVKLDDFPELLKADVGLLKIDVEGFELPVLWGAQRLIAHHRPVILVEAFPECQKRYGYSVEILKEAISKFDYTITSVGEETVRWDYWCTPNG